MEFSTLMEYISNNIFSIVISLIILYLWREDNIRHREEISAITDEHKEEVKSLTEVVQNNTLVMQKLIDKMES